MSVHTLRSGGLTPIMEEGVHSWMVTALQLWVCDHISPSLCILMPVRWHLQVTTIYFARLIDLCCTYRSVCILCVGAVLNLLLWCAPVAWSGCTCYVSHRVHTRRLLISFIFIHSSESAAGVSGARLVGDLISVFPFLENTESGFILDVFLLSPLFSLHLYFFLGLYFSLHWPLLIHISLRMSVTIPVTLLGWAVILLILLVPCINI